MSQPKKPQLLQAFVVRNKATLTTEGGTKVDITSKNGSDICGVEAKDQATVRIKETSFNLQADGTNKGGANGESIVGVVIDDASTVNIGPKSSFKILGQSIQAMEEVVDKDDKVCINLGTTTTLGLMLSLEKHESTGESANLVDCNAQPSENPMADQLEDKGMDHDYETEQDEN